MTFVYVLSSDTDDFLPEMALASMHSLKIYNKNAGIILITDAKTENTLTGDRARIRDYVNDILTIEVPDNLSGHQTARYLKTSARLYVAGDMLYLDNDTIILDNLENLNDFQGEMGAVINSHKENSRQEADIYIQKTGRDPWEFEKYFNSGVLLVKDTENTRKFYKDWHETWFYDISYFGIKMDQPSFSLANSLNNNIVEELPPVYNNQICSSNPHRFFFSPKVIHYFASSPSYAYFPFKRPEILGKIRKEGITEHIEKCLINPMEEFLKLGVLTSTGERETYDTPVYCLSRKYLPKLTWLNNLLDSIIKIRIKLARLK